jgi:hypothetical protein
MAEEQAAVSADEETGSEEEVTEAGSSAEGETEEKDESAPSDEEKREASEEDTGESEEEQESKPKKEGGFQRTIRKTKAQVTAERQAKESALAENAYLRQQLRERMEAEQPAAPEAKAKPDPKDFINEDTGELDQVAFTEAMSEYKAEQIVARRESQQEEERQKAKAEQDARELDRRGKAFAEASGIDDYKETVAVSAGVITRSGQTPTAVAISDVIFDEEQGPALLYHFGQNPDELESIAAMPPHRAVMALGRIGARLAGTEKKGDSEARTPPVSKAPKPLTPPRRAAGGKPARPDDPETADKLSPEEWQKARAKQVRDRAKRG